MTMTILGTTGDFPIFNNKKEEREREKKMMMMMVTMTIMMLAIRKQLKGYCVLTGRYI